MQLLMLLDDDDVMVCIALGWDFFGWRLHLAYAAHGGPWLKQDFDQLDTPDSPFSVAPRALK
jgi:hypothetical protein